MALLFQTVAPAPVPSWLGPAVIAACVAGGLNLLTALVGAYKTLRNGEKLELLRRGLDKSSLQEARAYTERLARVNPYVESLQASMQQCMDLRSTIARIQDLPFPDDLKKILLQSSTSAIGWEVTGLALSRLRFNIVLTLKKREQVISFLNHTAGLNVCLMNTLTDVWNGKFDTFADGERRFLALAVEIIEVLRTAADEVDVERAEPFRLEPEEITRLIQSGAITEVKIKIAPKDNYWLAWWGFNDLVGPGEEKTDLAEFLPVFDEVVAALRRLPTQLEVRAERELNIEKSREKDGTTQTYMEHSLALHVRFPSQAALDSFAPILESIKTQSRLIWVRPFIPREMQST